MLRIQKNKRNTQTNLDNSLLPHNRQQTQGKLGIKIYRLRPTVDFFASRDVEIISDKCLKNVSKKRAPLLTGVMRECQGFSHWISTPLLSLSPSPYTTPLSLNQDGHRRANLADPREVNPGSCWLCGGRGEGPVF